MKTSTATEKLFNHLLAKNYADLQLFCKRIIAKLSTEPEAWDSMNNRWYAEFDWWESFNSQLDVNFYTDGDASDTATTDRPAMYAVVYLYMNGMTKTARHSRIYATTEKFV